MAARTYPAPCYAVGDADLTDENLLRIAREMLRQHENMAAFPRPTITPGDRVLFVVPGRFDPRVRAAICAAIAEITVEPDVMIDNTPWPYGDGGEEELRLFRYYYVGPKNAERAHGFEEQLVHSFCEGRGYDVLLYAGGGSYSTPGSKDAKSFRWYGVFNWRSADCFASGIAHFPPKLQHAIDADAYSILRRARRVRLTDPEGTDISWSLRARDFELMEQRMGVSIAQAGHLNAVPFAAPLPRDASGTIAGTINHFGAFPHIAVHVSDSQLVGIEGGGAYGTGWWEAVRALAAVQYPGHPGPGWNWLMECAIGTNPKAVRARAFCGGDVTHERLRAGALHFGIGAALIAPGDGPSPASLAADKRRYREFIEANELPDGHHHVHAYFADFDVETEDGTHARLIDGGRLLALDKPAVREVAAEFADPDELLQMAWIPAVPGINVPGDYEEYGRDPLTWINERSELVRV